LDKFWQSQNCHKTGIQISTPLWLGHLSRAAQGAKLKIPLSRSFVSRPIEFMCQVSSTSA